MVKNITKEESSIKAEKSLDRFGKVSSRVWEAKSEKSKAQERERDRKHQERLKAEKRNRVILDRHTKHPASRPGIGSPETWVCVRRKNKSRKGRPEYELLQAARDGCLRCVRHKLGEMPKLANMVSDTNAWTVHDFARHAMGEGQPGAEQVVAYLTSSWPTLPRKP